MPISGIRLFVHGFATYGERSAAVVRKLVSETSYSRGIELLEGIVAMLTNIPISSTSRSKVALMFSVEVNVKVLG